MEESKLVEMLRTQTAGSSNFAYIPDKVTVKIQASGLSTGEELQIHQRYLDSSVQIYEEIGGEPVAIKLTPNKTVTEVTGEFEFCLVLPADTVNVIQAGMYGKYISSRSLTALSGK